MLTDSTLDSLLSAVDTCSEDGKIGQTKKTTAPWRGVNDAALTMTDMVGRESTTKSCQMYSTFMGDVRNRKTAACLPAEFLPD